MLPQLMQSHPNPPDISGLIGDTLHSWVSMETPTVLSKPSTKGPGENKSCTATLLHMADVAKVNKTMK